MAEKTEAERLLKQAKLAALQAEEAARQAAVKAKMAARRPLPCKVEDEMLPARVYPTRRDCT